MKIEQFKFTDIIWRFHMDAKLEELYFTLRRSDGSFYVRHREQDWILATPDSYVAQVFGVYNKIVIVQYFHREQLHKVSFFAAYRFGAQEPLWSNTENSILNMQGGYLSLNAKQAGLGTPKNVSIENGLPVDLIFQADEKEQQWTYATVSLDKHEIVHHEHNAIFNSNFILTITAGTTAVLEEKVEMEEPEWNHLHDYIIAYGANKLLLLQGKYSCSLYSFK